MNGDRDANGKTDELLVKKAAGGDREALEDLICRHGQWIYNIAFRMTGSIPDAEDAAQEILIKMIAKLSGFRGKSSFRTWLYRIVKNHVLNMKRSKGEKIFSSFQEQSELLHKAAGIPAANRLQQYDEDKKAVYETRVLCVTGMLLCLDRRQRLVFTLGAIFALRSDTGGKIMGTSAQNFRKMLSRARTQLKNYINGKCGLMNPDNPCRCALKTKAAISAGFVDPEKFVFTDKKLKKVKEMVKNHPRDIGESVKKSVDMLYREHPFLNCPDFAEILKTIQTPA